MCVLEKKRPGGFPVSDSVVHLICVSDTGEQSCLHLCSGRYVLC